MKPTRLTMYDLSIVYEMIMLVFALSTVVFWEELSLLKIPFVIFYPACIVLIVSWIALIAFTHVKVAPMTWVEFHQKYEAQEMLTWKEKPTNEEVQKQMPTQQQRRKMMILGLILTLTWTGLVIAVVAFGAKSWKLVWFCWYVLATYSIWNFVSVVWKSKIKMKMG